MPRERLPDRRRSITQKVHILDADAGSQTVYLSLGLYPDGRIGEIFVEAQKEGTLVRGIFAAFARMASLALQCGADPLEAAKILRGLEFPPCGQVEGKFTKVTSCTSTVDWFAQEIENYTNELGAAGNPAPQQIVDNQK